MQITYANSEMLGKTPARVNLLTGEIFINTDVWDTLPEAYQNFILAHEEGHYLAQTTNELMADHYAIMKLAGTVANSLKNAVATICDVLPGTNGVQQLRILNIYRLALLWDSLNSPQPQTASELDNVQAAIYSYRQLNELKDYEMILSQMKHGQPDDYDFPGYDARMFEPSIGSRFMDVPLEEREIKSTFAKQYKPFGVREAEPEPAPANWQQETPAADETDVYELIDQIPEFGTVEIDIKTLMIAACIILIFILINKLSR